MRPAPFDDFDSLFDIFARRLADLSDPDAPDGGPTLDVAVYGDEVVVFADLVGYAEEDVHVGVEDGSLLLHAHHGVPPFRTALTRTVPLPADLDADAATATFVNGVLVVTFPLVDGAAVVDAE